jgi:hypothetical protein
VVRAATAALILILFVRVAHADAPPASQPASQPASAPVAAPPPPPPPATLAAKVVESRPASLPAVTLQEAPKKRNKLVYAFAAGGVLLAIGLVALAGLGSSTQRIEVKWSP